MAGDNYEAVPSLRDVLDACAPWGSWQASYDLDGAADGVVEVQRAAEQLVADDGGQRLDAAADTLEAVRDLLITTIMRLGDDAGLVVTDGHGSRRYSPAAVRETLRSADDRLVDALKVMHDVSHSLLLGLDTFRRGRGPGRN